MDAEGLAGNACASGGLVATTAEHLRNGADIHMLIFRAQADSGECRFHFLKDHGDLDTFYGPDVIDESFTFLGGGSGLGIVALAKPKIGGFIRVRQSELAVDVAEQFDAREWETLVDLLADATKVGASIYQFCGRLQCVGCCARVLEAAGVGADGGKKAGRDRASQFPSCPFAQVVDQLTAAWLLGRDPIQVSVPRVRRVVIDVNEDAAVADVIDHASQAIEAGAVGGDDRVEMVAVVRLPDEPIGIQEPEFVRYRILIPNSDVLAQAF